ncbi:hypothetical protein ABK040_008560 [Willaertia magna]
MSINKLTQMAIITGGSKGIGLQITKQLISKGIHCITLSRNNISECLTNQYHYCCDVSNFEQVNETIKNIANEYHQKSHSINMLVNAAGISKDGLLVRFPQEDIEEILKINLLGTIYVTKSVLRNIMYKTNNNSNNNSIVNISSIIGTEMANSGQSIYSASKAGVLGFTKSLAQELLYKNIRVNCVSPGFIETEMTSEINNLQNTNIKKGKPEDIANIVEFLLSEKASYITGQNFIVDGGLTLQ